MLLCHAADAAAKLLPGVDGDRSPVRAGELHGVTELRATMYAFPCTLAIMHQLASSDSTTHDCSHHDASCCRYKIRNLQISNLCQLIHVARRLTILITADERIHTVGAWSDPKFELNL